MHLRDGGFYWISASVVDGQVDFFAQYIVEIMLTDYATSQDATALRSSAVSHPWPPAFAM